MGEDYVKETQNTLGKIIKKPPMTTKLLNKPPFRFLHDIITEVIKETGFMKGLYSDSDLDSSNVKDKESKIAFLQKAIDIVAMVTGQAMAVRPSKVVAGHEPDKTNEFLQAIAKACKTKPDSSEEVQRILKGEKPGSGKPPRPKKDEVKKRERSGKKDSDKEKKEKKSSSDNRNRSSSRDKDSKRDDGSREKNREEDKSKDKESRHRDKDREKEKGKDREKERGKDKDRDKNRERNKERSKDRHREKDRSKDRVRDDRSRDAEKEDGRGKGRDEEKERSTTREKDKDRKEQKKRKEEAVESHKAQVQQNEIHNDDEGEDLRPVNGENEDGVSSNRIPRPSSAKGQRRRPMKDGNSGESDQKTSNRHSKDERVAVNNDEDNSPAAAAPTSRRPARPSSARPAPPRLKKQESTDKDESRVGSGKQVSNVIVDDAQNSEDEDESFVVEESQPLIDEPGPMQSESIEDDGDHGGLVKKILETKKELEGTKNEQKEEKPVIMDAAHRKQRELIQREVEKLRGSIQTLTRSANPLGKIMDYLQEDVDSMQKELEMWKKENRDHGLAIKREQSITDSELEPLRAQLSELDQSVVDRLDTIAMVKSNILRNDEKIQKMMGSVAYS